MVVVRDEVKCIFSINAESRDKASICRAVKRQFRVLDFLTGTVQSNKAMTNEKGRDQIEDSC